MSTYKRIPRKLIKSLLMALFAPVAVSVAMLILLLFFDTLWFFVLAVVLVCGTFLFMIHSAIWGENVRFEITSEGTLYYYCGKNLVRQFDLIDCSVGYHHLKNANGGTESLRLRITDKDGNNEIIDCEPIGERKFYIMFEEMQSFSNVAPERLN